jgi:hypothetical protein
MEGKIEILVVDREKQSAWHISMPQRTPIGRERSNA